MANPYYVDPMGGYGPSIVKGLGGLGQAIGQNMQQRRMQEQQTAMQQELMQAYQSQDPDQVAQVMFKYPEASKVFDSAIGFRDQATANNMVTSAREILANPDRAEQILQSRIAMVEARGGDATETRETLEEYRTDPQGFIRSAEMVLASKDPEAFKAYQAATAGPDYQQGTGAMSGYVFNPETGEYKVNPAIKQQLETDAAQKAAKEGMLDSKDIAGVNDKVTALTKDTTSIKRAASSLESLKGKGSAAAKLAAIFKFMKALDPTSVVRESEQGMVVSAQGLPDQFVAMVNEISGKGKLTETGFQDVVDTAKTLANSAIQSSRQEVDDYLSVLEDKMPEATLNKLKKRVPEGFDIPGGGVGVSNLSEQDRQALEWANKNPDDPRAVQIKRMLEAR